MTNEDLETLGKAVYRTINQRLASDNQIKALCFTVGDKVRWKHGKYGGERTGTISKKNRSRATIRVGGGLHVESWSVPYSMLSIIEEKPTHAE